MIYLQRNNRKRDSRRPFFIAALVIVCALSVWLFGISVPQIFTAPIYGMARPLWAVENFFGNLGSDLWGMVHTKAALVRENRALRQKIEARDRAFVDYEHLQQENKELERFARRNRDVPRILGYVLAKPGIMPYDTFIIDVGSKDGVIVGDRVLVGDTVAVGSVVALQRSISKVQFISSPGVVTPVLLGSSALPVDAHGFGGGILSITVPRGVAVSIGDALYLPTAPRLYLGAVLAVDLRPADALKTVFVRLPVNLFELSSVAVAHLEVATDASFVYPGVSPKK